MSAFTNHQVPCQAYKHVCNYHKDHKDLIRQENGQFPFMEERIEAQKFQVNCLSLW